jgi:hypothetical protein
MKKASVIAVLCCTALLYGCSDSSSSSSVKETTTASAETTVSTAEEPTSAETTAVTAASTEPETEAATSSAKYDQLTLDDINSKAAVVEQEPNCILIQGNFTDFKIESEEDAFKALASIADVIGCKDIDNEIQFYKSAGNSEDYSYVFHQHYKGLRTNSYILLQVKNDTKEIETLYCNYFPEINVDMTPTFTVEQVKEYVEMEPEKRAGEDLTNYGAYEEPELIISMDREEPRLAWMVRFTEGEVKYIIMDAHTGELIMGSHVEDI